MSSKLENEDNILLSDDLSNSSDDEETNEFPELLILTTGLWTIFFAFFSLGYNPDP